MIAVYFTASRRWNLLPAFIVGGLGGLAPLLVYNVVCFGHPLQLSQVAGNYSDTFFRFHGSDFLGKLRFYGRMLTVYAPVCWLGWCGLAFFPRSLRREQILLLGMLLALAAYILNIGASGTCQYGPRYLLPAMPLMSLGLMGFSFLRAKANTLTAGLASVVFIVSFLINLMGAMHGAMLCDFPHFAAWRYFLEMWNSQMRSYPLAAALVLPLALCMILFVHAILRSTNRSLRAGA